MKRNWFAVLTAQVLYDTKITDTQKILYAIVSNLTNETGYCYASNGYLAEILNCSQETIRRHLSALEVAGYIYRHKSKKEGREQRLLYLNTTPPTELRGTPHKVKGDPPTELWGIITKTNNKIENPLLVSNKLDTNTPPQDFDKLWNEYGKKVGKAPALRSWKRLSKKERNLVTEHIVKYLENHRTADKLKFLPHLSTYLNQRRWEEELPYESETKDSDKGWELN